LQDGRVSTGDRLAGRILTACQRAGLEPGGRLPTERQLAADLGVTRTAVRHALAVLQSQGRISREVGRGTFLHETGVRSDGPAEGADFAPADVMLVRRLLEPQAMPLVVAWATARDFAEMDRCLAGGDAAADYGEFEAWDVALHRAIIAASHSPLLAALYASIEKARHGPVWGELKRRSASQERRERYQADHRELVAALRARDAGRATEAMRAHLALVAEHLIGGA
jgi:DNA-binding FadR family transcriptional regulator